jgi:hypothetical protein
MLIGRVESGKVSVMSLMTLTSLQNFSLNSSPPPGSRVVP